ncbi:MAG TPA: putative sugar O-methyltransferase [Pyrinomonadaceae bacterium]|nr:putative sugar O-methyltransferase [Pyrinomonadaceae bacterium]
MTDIAAPTADATKPGMESALRAMGACLARGNPVYLPSKFWDIQNEINFKQLEDEGVENIKQTVALNYFTFVGRQHSQSKYLFEHTSRLSWPSILYRLWQHRLTVSIAYRTTARDTSSRMTPEQQVELTVFTKMLWQLARQVDTLKLLERIEEPEVGNPFKIFRGGRLISQDLANSVIEFYSIREHFSPAPGEPVRVGELGAGYGRNAYVFLKALPNCKYVVVDIPPALYVSQHYLSSVFPGKRVFKFRCFESFAEVEDEFMASDIAFLLPHQAEMLPAKSLDLFVNISSLHEMRPEQIGAYFALIDRLTRGYFYSKQWFVSENPHDGIRIRHDDYPVPAHWRQLYLRPARVQTEFFEAMYEVGASA